MGVGVLAGVTIGDAEAVGVGVGDGEAVTEEVGLGVKLETGVGLCVGDEATLFPMVSYPLSTSAEIFVIGHDVK